MIVFFKEKSKSASDYISFSEKSLDRRTKKNVQFDEKDLPVSSDFLMALNQDGEILNVSRWLNAVSYSTLLTPDELLSKYDFISHIKSMGNAKPANIKNLDFEVKDLEYGTAIDQIQQLNLDCLHNMGYTGQGIYVGIIDAGFNNMDGINYFDSVYLENRILDSFNFVNVGQTIYASSGHGTSVSSCIVGEKLDPEAYGGGAIDVNLALYLTEDVASETEIEEFNLVAALERCDSVGVDVVNISLGYFNFDDTLTSHVYGDLDGQTTIAAIGINIAATKGIVVSTSAGNSGPGNISTPCDADGGLCVGAVDVMGIYASFSSVGPAADGEVKPDVVATGQDTWLISAGGNLTTGNGTSFSSPLMAAATACLVQANPTKTVPEIIDAIRQSAHQYATPDDLLGYGIPDFCLAHDILNPPSGVGLTEINADMIDIYPVPSSDYFVIDNLNSEDEMIEIELFNSMGETVLHMERELIDNKIKVITEGLSNGVYTLQIINNSSVGRKKVLLVD
jgi:serine protease AprX